MDEERLAFVAVLAIFRHQHFIKIQNVLRQHGTDELGLTDEVMDISINVFHHLFPTEVPRMQTNHPIDPPQQNPTYVEMRESILQDANYFVDAIRNGRVSIGIWRRENPNIEIKMKIPPITEGEETFS